jgi:hypothetical protein
MKTLIITLTLLAGALAAQAQETITGTDTKTTVNPAQSISIDKNTTTTYTPSSIRILSNIPVSALKGAFVDTSKKNAYIFYPNALAMSQQSKMPNAKLPNTDLNMPVTQTDKTGYTMPVKGKSLSRIYIMPKPATVPQTVTPQ